MARLIFTSHLNGTAPRGDQCYSGTSVGAVLEAAFADHPGLRHYVVDDQGRLRKHVVVFVDDAQIARGDEWETPVGDGNTIYVLQALSGGQVAS